MTFALATAGAGGGQSSTLTLASAERFSIRIPALRPERAGSPRGEGALIRQAQSGSEEAIEQLFRSHWPRAWRAAYLVVHDGPAAEDIAQEAFLAAIRSLDRFDRRRPFGPWLHRIVVNRAIDWSRARALRSEVAAADESPAARIDAPSSPYSDDVVAALGSLPAEHRAIVVLRYLLEFTPGEIADVLDLPRGTVNSRLRRALDRLGERLGEDVA
jgi:RNA polymerase sigma-70 factor (ECF subfamily)